MYGLFILFVGCQTSSNNLLYQEQATEDQVYTAFYLASEKEGSSYKWGADGPNQFDCSGLIVWAYQESLKKKYIFTDGLKVIDDSTIDNIFEHNIIKLNKENVIPGDIIFITNVNNKITHGGIVSEITDISVSFINASSYHNEVVFDTWLLDEEIRGQWIVGYGRILISH